MNASHETLDARGIPCPGPVILVKKALAGGDSRDLEVLVDNEAARENVLRFASWSGCGILSADRIDAASGDRSPVYWRIRVRPAAGKVAGDGALKGESRAAAAGTEPTGVVAVAPSGMSPTLAPTLAKTEPAGDVADAAHVAAATDSVETRPVPSSSSGPEVGAVEVGTRLPRECGTVFVATDSMGQGSEELGRLLMRGFLYALTERDTVPDRLILMNSGVRLAASGSESLANLKKLGERGVEILVCGACVEYFGLKADMAVGRISNMYEIAGFLMEERTLRI